MRKPLSGESLGDVISDEILQEWDFEKNGLTPFDYSRGSLKKGWWKCSYCDHSWETSARSRSNGSKCPICSNIKRDLTATGDWTQVLKYEWDDNNGNPRQFGVGSSKKLKWNCQKCEQSWMASISYRIYRKAKCPYCEGHKAISGKTDFATLYPKLLEEWNFEKNNVSPYLILPILGEKIWWICEYKHEWNLSIPQRLKYDTLCPVCSHKVLLRGFNDLITIYPKIAKQWNLEKNINLKPSDFT